MKILWIALVLSSSLIAKTNLASNTGQIIVKLNSNKSSVLNYKFKRRFLLENGLYAIVQLSDKTTMVRALNDLRSQKSIAFAEPNYLYQTSTKDALFDKLWALNSKKSPKVDIDAIKAWGISKGSDKIKIAVIDTGVDYSHKDLKQNILINEKELNGSAGVDDDGNGYIDDVYGWDFANNDNDPMDDNGHGTHCAGTIGAAHNSIGVAGVMANVSILPIKFIKASGSGSVEAAIKSIDYAIKMGVDVMSNSWGGEGKSDILKDSIKRAQDKGILFIAAAGNSNSNNDLVPQYPASYQLDNIISVASTTRSGNLSDFSCYGKKSVHIAAPGSDIMSTFPGDKYKSLSGTSMATPHVAGVVGLYLSKNPKSNYLDIKDKLMRSSDYSMAYDSTIISKGRLNANNLLRGIFPKRPEMPSDDEWIIKKINLESSHPYPIDHTQVFSIEIPEAKFIKLHIEKYDIEKKYDSLRILDKKGDFIDAISGSGTDYISSPIAGNKISLELMSDISVNRWGFKIVKIEYAK